MCSCIVSPFLDAQQYVKESLPQSLKHPQKSTTKKYTMLIVLLLLADFFASGYSSDRLTFLTKFKLYYHDECIIRIVHLRFPLHDLCIAET